MNLTGSYRDMRNRVNAVLTGMPELLIEFHTAIVCACVRGIFVNGLRGGWVYSNNPS